MLVLIFCFRLCLRLSELAYHRGPEPGSGADPARAAADRVGEHMSPAQPSCDAWYDCVCVGEQGLAQPMRVREGPSWAWWELTCSLTQARPLVGPGHPHSRRVHWGEASLDSGLRLSPPFSPKLGSTHSACPGTGKSGLAHAELHRAGA